jgi:di/tripeptidase
MTPETRPAATVRRLGTRATVVIAVGGGLLVAALSGIVGGAIGVESQQATIGDLSAELADREAKLQDITVSGIDFAESVVDLIADCQDKIFSLEAAYASAIETVRWAAAHELGAAEISAGAAGAAKARANALSCG